MTEMQGDQVIALLTTAEADLCKLGYMALGGLFVLAVLAFLAALRSMRGLV